MLSKSTYNTIKEGLKSGLYKSIRLVKIDPEGDQYLIGFNRIKSDGLPNTLGRLDHFKKLLDKSLDPGKYEIQASGNLIHGMIEKFPVQVFEKKVATLENNNSVQEHLNVFEILEDDDFMDKDEYKKLMRDLSTLQGQVTTLTLERDWYKNLHIQNHKDQGLSDKTSWQQSLAEVAKEAIPGIVNFAQDYMAVRKQELSDKTNDREGKIKIKKSFKPAANDNPILSYYTDADPENVIDHYHDLLDSNNDLANEELDAMELHNPALYKIVDEALFREEEEEEEEEDQTGT